MNAPDPSPRRRVVFVQPFGLLAHGGGPRILRTLVAGREHETASVYTALPAPGRVPGVLETRLPLRPELPSRLERSRLGGWLDAALGVLSPVVLARRVRRVLEPMQPECVHVVAHSLEFGGTFRAARRVAPRVVLTIHDDPLWVVPPLVRPLADRWLGRAWRDADARTVISTAMGDEMNRRYGTREFDVITDCLDTIAPPGTGPAEAVYFCGSMHVSYADNFVALVELLERRDGARLICRSGPPEIGRSSAVVEVRPWASDEEVARDLTEVGSGYLPLPFDDRHFRFVQYSLSTKMVSYLGAGLPILYHGPRGAAACQLLEQYDAAVVVDSLDPADLDRGWEELDKRRDDLAVNAQRLAAEHFDAERVRERFWAILLGEAPATGRAGAE